MFSRNTNASSISALHANPTEFFKKGFMESYGNFIPTSGSVAPNAKLQLDYLTQLSHYEDSYAWALKRFYLFNTLPSVGRVSYPSPKTTFATESLEAPTSSALQQYNLVKSLGRQNFNLLSDQFGGTSGPMAPGQNPTHSRSLIVSTGVSELFDYDFTETALNLLNSPIINSRYYS